MSKAVTLEPTYFVIDVDQLKIKSRKPHHLEDRLQSLNHKKYTMEQHRIAHQSRFHRRAQILESRKRSCSERVSKAKSMAENYSKRSLKNEFDQHQKMDSILVPRDDSDSISSSHEDAVLSIQTWWRMQKVTKVARLYKKMGLSLESSKTTTFSKLSKLIQSDAMARAVGRMLVRAKRTSTEPVSNWKNPTRIFLSSYMIVSHPQEVFANVGPEEEDLQEYALKMLVDFEDWMNLSNTSKVLIQGRKFLSSWVMFYEAFENWKSGNQEKIAQDLITHFMDLEKLWLTVRNQEDAELEWMENISRQQKQVFSRLNRFGAHYMNDLFSKRKTAYDSFLAHESNDESSCKALTILSTSVDVYPIAIRSRRDSVTRSLPDSETSSNRGTGKQSSLGIESEETLKSIWSNQKLAHELILDPEFRMKRSDTTSLEGQVAEISKKVFFENIKAEFDAGNFKQAIGLIGDIREMLIGLLPSKSKVIVELREALDTQLIEQQIEKNVFDVRGCINYVTGKMLQFCAPVRDSTIRSVKEETDIVVMFQRTLDILEDMKLDLINYQLQSIKPLVKDKAVEYEQQKFNESLEKKDISLKKTTAWLKKHSEDSMEIATSRNPENLQHEDLKVSYERVFHDAVMGLIFSAERLSPIAIPETFYMDIERLLYMQNEAQALSIVAAILMLLKNIVPSLRSQPSIVSDIKKDILALLEAPDTGIDNIALHIITILKKASGISGEQESIIQNMVVKTVSLNDGVYSLISRRMQLIIRHQMEKTIFKKESLASYGLDTIENELENLSRRVYILANHNKQVYVQHYDRILNLLV